MLRTQLRGVLPRPSALTAALRAAATTPAPAATAATASSATSSLPIPPYPGAAGEPAIWSDDLTKIDETHRQWKQLASNALLPAGAKSNFLRALLIYPGGFFQKYPYFKAYSQVTPQSWTSEPHLWEYARSSFERALGVEGRQLSETQKATLWEQFIPRFYLAEWLAENRAEESMLFLFRTEFIFNSILGLILIVLLLTGLPAGKLLWKLLLADGKALDKMPNWQVNLITLFLIREGGLRATKYIRRTRYFSDPNQRSNVKKALRNAVTATKSNPAAGITF